MSTGRSAGRGARWSTTGVVVGVAVIAAVVSYRHALEVIRTHGESGPVAYLVPLTVDGLIYASSMVLFVAARRGVAVPPLARVLLALGIAATLAANIAHGLDHGAVGAIVAGWPAVALVGSYELLMWIVRTGRSGPAADTPGSGAAGSVFGSGHENAPEPVPATVARDVQAVMEANEFAAEFAAGHVPSIRRIRVHLGSGQPRAKRVHERLCALDVQASAREAPAGEPLLYPVTDGDPHDEMRAVR